MYCISPESINYDISPIWLVTTKDSKRSTIARQEKLNPLVVGAYFKIVFDVSGNFFESMMTM